MPYLFSFPDDLPFLIPAWASLSAQTPILGIFYSHASTPSPFHRFTTVSPQKSFSPSTPNLSLPLPRFVWHTFV